jgi:hypothetical protein
MKVYPHGNYLLIITLTVWAGSFQFFFLTIVTCMCNYFFTKKISLFFFCISSLYSFKLTFKSNFINNLIHQILLQSYNIPCMH